MSRDGDDHSSWGIASWIDAYGEGTPFLTESAVRRVAQYYRSIANLTRQGSAEPRLWIGAVQALWSGMADDYGDFLRRYGGVGDEGADPIEVPAGPTVVAIRTDERSRIDEKVFEIDLPSELFDSTFASAKLSTKGLFSGKRCVLQPGRHLLLEPAEVTGRRHPCKLRLMNLPEGLIAGMTLVGTILAERKLHDRDAAAQPSPARPLLVAVVHLQVI